VACQTIIDARGMPPKANFTAFAFIGDIERDRGDFEEAKRSYSHAERWSRRMSLPERDHAAESIESRRGKLREAIAAAQTGRQVSYITIAESREPICVWRSPSTVWQRACLRAKQTPNGAALHTSLRTQLRPIGASLPQLLACDAELQKSGFRGADCFENLGLKLDDGLLALLLTALQFEVLVTDHMKE